MAGAGLVASVLPEGALAALAPDTLETLEQFFSQQLEELFRLRALKEASHQASEERIRHLENEILTTSKKKEECGLELKNAREENKELLCRIETKDSELSEARESLKIFKSNADNFRLQRDSAIEVRDSLTNMIETRNTEIECLKTTIENLQSQLEVAVNVKCDVLSKNSSIQSKAMTLDYRDKYIEQEKVGQNNQIDVLKNELHRYSSDLQTVRGNLTSMKVNFERQLSKKNDELNIANAKLSKLNELKEHLCKKNESLNSKINDLLEKENKVHEEYKNELITKTKVGELYKSIQEESNAKNEQLTRVISELRKLLNESVEKYEELETQTKQAELNHQKEIDKKIETICLLNRELENANDLLQMTDSDNLNAAMEDLSPSANIAFKLIKSRMSLTQAYDQLIQTSEELRIEKNENKRLSHALTSIVNELEEKAPLIDQQKRQNEDALENISALTQRLETLMFDYNQLKSENGEFEKITNMVRKENIKLKVEIETFSRQVCFLLKEVEAKKGRFCNMDVSNDVDFKPFSLNGSSDSNASYMINKNLVTFSDISELQSNNQKLLKLVRELSDKNEEKDQAKNQMETKDSQSKIEILQSRISELMEAQDRQIKMINKLVEQVDKCKCNDKGNQSQDSGHNNTRMDLDVTNKSDVSKAFPNQYQYIELVETQLADTKKELNQEREKHRTYVEKTNVNELKLIETNASIHKQFSELQSKYAKCLSSSEIVSEKVKVLDIELTNYKKEIFSLNEKINSYTSLIGKQESSLKKANNDLAYSRKRLSQAESLINKLKTENSLLKDTSKTISSEKSSQDKNRQERSSALESIESIRKTIEDEESTSSLKLQLTLEEANRTCTTLRCMLQEEQEKYHDLASHLKQEVDLFKLKIDQERSENQQLKDSLDCVQKELTIKSATIEELNKKILCSGFPEQNVNAELASALKSRGNSINEHLLEINTLRQQLEISKSHIEKYCNIYECSEKELKSVNAMYMEFRQKSELKLQEMQMSEEELLKKYSKIESELAKRNEELTLSQNKLNLISQELIDKTDCLNKSTSDVAKLSETIQLVEEKYAREIVLHSNDIQSLTELKDQLLKANQNISDLMRAKLEIESTIKENNKLWESREKLLVEENEEIKGQISDVSKQNALLHDQIQALSTKLTLTSQNSEKGTDLSSVDANSSLGEADIKSSEQLLDIIKYLRKEKDILVTKFDIMQAENLRLKSQLETIETQLDEAKLNIGVVKSESETSSVSAKHSGVLRKVEALNAISDCYINLREERDNLLNRIEELSESYKTLQDTLTPLNESNCELSMKINLLQSENISIKNEMNKWKSRVDCLIGKDNQSYPDDWKRLQNEREALGKMLSAEKENVKKISEEAAKFKSDNLLLEEQIDKARKQQTVLIENLKKKGNELNIMRKDVETLNQELSRTKATVEEKNKENVAVSEKLSSNEVILQDVRNKELQIRKIAKRYKMQYEELIKTVEEEKQKTATLMSEATLASENHVEACKELQQKILDLEKSHTEKKNELDSKISNSEEENKKLANEINALKGNIKDIEEKAKQAIKNAKTKIGLLIEAKDNLTKELNDAKNMVDFYEQNKDENDVRLQALKSQYDGRLSKLEKEKTQLLQDKQTEINQLKTQIESLSLKIAQMQRKVDSHQTPKPSTSSNQGEKSGSEPPTANIKPMAGISSQRDANRRIAGETPLASIRPMASHSGVRFAAVSPTTAQPPSHTVHHQAPHTTGSVSGEMTSSPSSSHQTTEYLPSSSSTGARIHPPHARHVTLPPPESTQDMDTEITVENDPSVGATLVSAPLQSTGNPQLGPQQGVALVMPRMENTTDAQPTHGLQQQASSSSSNNSSSTVTTSHGQSSSSGGPVTKSDPRAFKRPRMTSARPQQKIVLKRLKTQGFQRVTESEAEYQVPTSSQRDQEDDIHFVDSDDEESYQDRIYEAEEDDDLENKDITGRESRNIEETISEDREASVNNEAEVTNNLTQEGRTTSSEDSISRRTTDDSPAGDRAPLSTLLSTPLQEQQIETISSGNGIDGSFLVIGTASGVTSAVVSGAYEDGDDSIVPSTPTLYVPTRNDGFGEAVRSPMTARGPSANEGRFTFSEDTTTATGGAMEDTHADLAPQLTPHNHTSSSNVASVSAEGNIAVLESSEAEIGGSNVEVNTDDDPPTVSSQGSSGFSTQVEEGREAEASSTAVVHTPSRQVAYRGTRGMKSTRRGHNTTHVGTPRPTEHHQRPSPIVWNADPNFRRGAFPQQRLQRGSRHVIRRPPEFFKRY